MGSDEGIIFHSKLFYIKYSKAIITLSTFAELTSKRKSTQQKKKKSQTLTCSQSPPRFKLFHFKNHITNVSKIHKLLDIPLLPRCPSTGLLTEIYAHTD